MLFRSSIAKVFTATSGNEPSNEELLSAYRVCKEAIDEERFNTLIQETVRSLYDPLLDQFADDIDFETANDMLEECRGPHQAPVNHSQLDDR